LQAFAALSALLFAFSREIADKEAEIALSAPSLLAGSGKED
jgi:hypothetical protein